MNRRIRDVVNWWEDVGNFSFFDMIDLFKGSDCGPSIVSFCGGEDRGRSVKDGSVCNGIYIGGARGRVVVFAHGYSEEVEVREEKRVLVKVCELG